MKNKQLKLVLVLLINVLFLQAQSIPAENTFFRPGEFGSNTETVNGLTGASNTSDSGRINTAISSLSNRNSSNGKRGGVLRITGNRTLNLANIKLKKNVWLKIDKGITIKPLTAGATIFFLGEENGQMENVAVTSMNDDNSRGNAFKVELTAGVNKNSRVVKISNVKNFKFSGVDISDRKTRLSSVILGLKKNSNNRSQIPTNGILANVWVKNAHVGYGLTQVQASKNVLFKRLFGEGGVTVRLETGLSTINNAKNLTLDKIFVDNVSVSKGDAALNLSPHRINQGSVVARGVSASNSSWAVQLAAGFLDKTGSVNNVGRFGSVTIAVSNVSGGSGAQVKGKDIPLFKCGVTKTRAQLQASLAANGAQMAADGHSIAMVRNTAGQGCTSGCYGANVRLPSGSGTFERGNVKTVTKDESFSCTSGGGGGNNPPPPAGGGDVTPAQCKRQCRSDFPKGRQRRNCINACDSSSKNLTENDALESVEISYKLYPNPATDKLHIDYAENTNVQIYSITGLLIKSIENISNKEEIDVSKLQSGFYLVKISSKNNTTVKRVVIN